MIEPVIKVNKTQVHVQYGSYPALELEFLPLVKKSQALEPCNNFVLKHWQARPKGERRWGVFEWRNGKTRYCSYVEPKISVCRHFDIQLPEGEHLPTSAIFYPDAALHQDTVVFLPRWR